LRGRCARQGDPGSSRFYVSLEDDLMRLFGSERIAGIMEKLGIEEGEVLEHKWLNKSIERAQRRVEQHNFSIRKRTLEYDDVMNKQREIIYKFRSEVVPSADVSEQLFEVVEDVVQAGRTDLAAKEDEEAVEGFVAWVNATFPIGLKREQLPAELNADNATELVVDRVKKAYEVKAQLEDQQALRPWSAFIVLQAIDTHWQEYLRSMDALRQGVGLRAYGQRDPLVEYKREAFTMFSDLMDKIKTDIATRMFRSATSFNAFRNFMSALPQMYVHEDAQAIGKSETPPSPPASARPSPRAGAEAAMQAALNAGQPAAPKSNLPEVGRNDPCPCGSGKKYKKCHGASA
jgi:preprotein translocase subunit SecA